MKSKPPKIPYMQEAVRYTPLTREEEILLARKSKGEGEEARLAKEEFFLRNMRLVGSIVRGFTSSELNSEDLLQEASIGLIRAVEKFDPDKGFRFSTYATWWIRQSIFKMIYRKDEIRIPSNLVSKKRILNRVLKEFPSATDEEILSKTGFTEKALSTVRTLPSSGFLEDLCSEEGLSYAEILPPENPKQEENSLLAEQVESLTARVLEDLCERDRDIYISWVAEGKTLRQISEVWGVTPERVRQIIWRTSNKVRVLAGEKPRSMPRRKPTKKKLVSPGGEPANEG